MRHGGAILLLVSLVACGEGAPDEPRPKPSVPPTPTSRTEVASGLRDELAAARSLHRGLDAGAALSAFEDIERRAGELGETMVVIEAMLGRGDVLREAGAPDRALRPYDTALETAGTLTAARERDRWTARTLRQRAQARSRVGGDGSTAAARSDLDRAAELYQLLGATQEVAGVEAVRAILASQTGRFAEAVEAGRNALDALDTASESPERLGALSAVAYGLDRLGRGDEAIAAYEELIELAWRRDDQRLILFAYCNRAEILRRRGETGASEEDLVRAVARIETQRAALPTTPDERSRALERQVAAYDRLIRLLADSYRSDEAFTVAERFRARSFLDLLTAARRGDPLPDAAAEPSTAPKIDEVAAALRPGQVLVAYWLLEDRLLAWVVTSDDRRFVQVPTPRADLVRDVTDYLEELRSPALARTAALAETEGAHLEVGLTLHRRLLGSLGAIAEGANELLVVPDGVLHYLPLGALPSACGEDPEGETTDLGDDVLFAAYRKCRWVGLERSVVYLPSTAVLLELAAREAPPEDARGAFVLAPRFASVEGLRGSLREARRIADLVPGSRHLEGDAAVESTLGAAAAYRFLHFATHGVVSDDDPIASGVRLATNDGGDGILRADEVLRLHLPHRLVSLAACRSGRGPLRRGEGLVGLSRAFLTAGARSVLVSLWDVEDEASARLMPDVYAELAADVPVGEALRLARKRLFLSTDETALVFRRHRRSRAHPGIWAPFVVVGLP